MCGGGTNVRIIQVIYLLPIYYLSICYRQSVWSLDGRLPIFCLVLFSVAIQQKRLPVPCLVMTPPNDTSVCRSAAAEAWSEVLVASVPASLRAGSLSLAAGWMLASAGLQEVDFGDSPE